MYAEENDSAQESLEKACSLDCTDVRNWLAIGCNALCRGDAGVAEAEQCAGQIAELGCTTETTKNSPSLMCHTLMQDFIEGLQQFDSTKKLPLVSRHLKAITNTSKDKNASSQQRPSTVPVSST